jgi:hypothetical protein
VSVQIRARFTVYKSDWRSVIHGLFFWHFHLNQVECPSFLAAESGIWLSTWKFQGTCIRYSQRPGPQGRAWGEHTIHQFNSSLKWLHNPTSSEHKSCWLDILLALVLCLLLQCSRECQPSPTKWLPCQFLLHRMRLILKALPYRWTYWTGNDIFTAKY